MNGRSVLGDVFYQDGVNGRKKAIIGKRLL
jgi:hypothetical protein